MDKKQKISVSGVPETMLQTMYARAKESENEHPHIYDKKAVEVVSRLDYDFSNADKDTMMSSGVIARTILLDGMVEEFLNRHPDTIVANIACGMDLYSSLQNRPCMLPIQKKSVIMGNRFLL